MRISYKRYRDIQQSSHHFALSLKLLSYPVEVIGIINKFADCRAVPYSRHCSNMYGNSKSLFMKSIPSYDAYTDYNKRTQQYIVYYNDDFIHPWSAGRMRFTLAHELAHVILDHHTTYERHINGLLSREMAEYLDKEADVFAAEFVAPTPLLLAMSTWDKNINPQLISLSFGLSSQAGALCYEALNQKIEYLNRNKLTEEKDMVYYPAFKQLFYETLQRAYLFGDFASERSGCV